MSEHNITVGGGASVRLKTAGKYCDRDIVVTASGGAETVISNNKTMRADDAFVNIKDTSLSLNYPNATYVDYRAFVGCESIISVDAPKVDELAGYAFDGCVSLIDVNFPIATKVGFSAFGNCTSLTNVRLPNATVIGDDAFTRCASLTKVDLGAATNIKSFVFYYCTSLTTLILRTTETVCVIDLTAFDESAFLFNSSTGTNNGHIYVPAVMYEYYRAGYEAPLASVLGEGAFDRIVRKIEDYPEICG